MADLELTQDAPRDQLAERLAHIRAGMLGVEGAGMHAQPMTHFPEIGEGRIWFITSRETDIAKAAGSGAPAHYVVVGPDGDYYASLRGRLVQVDDEKKIDDLWSSMSAAWFGENGREDHAVTLLRFDIEEAAIWATTQNPVVFAMEMAKSVGSDHKPDIGDHEVIAF